jgi:hypothetical protein
MIMDDEIENGSAPGKSGRSFKDGNIGPDGNYLVGKNRPPVKNQFAVADGRKRGRRSKGQRNFDTEFIEEAERKVTLTEGGKKRTVSKLRRAIIQAFQQSGVEGSNQAINTVFETARRIADKVAPALGLSSSEDATVNDWLQQRLRQQMQGDDPGDPEGSVFDEKADSETDTNKEKDDD